MSHFYPFGTLLPPFGILLVLLVLRPFLPLGRPVGEGPKLLRPCWPRLLWMQNPTLGGHKGAKEPRGAQGSKGSPKVIPGPIYDPRSRVLRPAQPAQPGPGQPSQPKAGRRSKRRRKRRRTAGIAIFQGMVLPAGPKSVTMTLPNQARKTSVKTTPSRHVLQCPMISGQCHMSVAYVWEVRSGRC